MSEQLRVSHERHEASPDNSHEQKERLEKAMEAAEKAHNEHEDSIESIRHHIKETAVSGKDQGHEAGRDQARHSSLVIDKTVKRQAYRKTLKHIQHKLPKSQRTFSKFIHQPTVETVSEVGAKTIARPSGLLGAGTCAFLGTTVVVWMSRHYGFRYNFTFFVLLVLCGFMLGLAFELFTKTLRKLLRRS